MARQSTFFYPFAAVGAVVAAVFCAVSGRWGWFALVVALGVAHWFQYLVGRFWLRAEEDRDVDEWLAAHPDDTPDPGESSPE